MKNLELDNSGFLHISAEGWLSPPRRLAPEQSTRGGGMRYIDPTPAKISAFYVLDNVFETIQFSFAFLSPEDAKLGLFDKSGGRMLALRRFYGIDGENRSGVVLKVSNLRNFSPHAIAMSFLTSISNGFLTDSVVVETKLGPREHREIIKDRFNGKDIVWLEDDEINWGIIGVVGTFKVPNWIDTDYWLEEWELYDRSIQVNA